MEFLEVYDEAYQAVTAVVDMPNREAGLLVRIILQNGGRLSKYKPEQFLDLTDEEVHPTETPILSILRTSGRSEADPEGEPTS